METETQPPAQKQDSASSNTTAGAPFVVPIADLASRSDFPQCTLGQMVDIGGFTGVVVEVVHNSIKVRSPEERTRSFNFHTLRKLYGPPPPEPEPMLRFAPEQPEPKKPAAVAAPVTHEIPNPNFDREPRPIREFVSRNDFPECILGEMVEINGYSGVVVEIIEKSLKVRSREGTSRKYNSDILRKLHGAQENE